MNRHSKLLVLTLLILLMLSVYDLNLASAQTESLDVASSYVNQAFEAVLNAEKAGSNVESLLDQLNNATTLLTEAENAYKYGDSSAVNSKVNTLILIASQVSSQAKHLKEEAENSANTALMSTLTSTIIGIMLVIIVSLIAWRFIKRSHAKDPIEARDVVNYET